MRLDTVTLTLVSMPIIALQGMLLLYSWSRNREVRALAWWGAALVMAAIGLTLLLTRGIIPFWLSVTAGNAAVFFAQALFWSGFRVFERRVVHVPWLFAGPLVWLAACGIPAVYKSDETRVLLSCLLVTLHMAAAVREIWRGRHEVLGSRNPIIAVIVLHILFTLSRTTTGGLFGEVADPQLAQLQRLTVLSYESLLFAMIVSFLLLNLVKERIEAEQRSIASRDPLTGTLNRRAFVERGRDLLDRARRAGRPCALVIADLDHFKSVNDRFGHAAGDQVLTGLSCLAGRALPTGGLLVRLGGEEFGLLVTGTQAMAGALAERIRADLEATRFETEHEAFRVTVSMGVATTEDVGHILDALMAAADVALYQAKSRGRNRIEAAADPDLVATGLTNRDGLALAA